MFLKTRPIHSASYHDNFTTIYIIEHHTPKLHQFVKPGTKFSMEDLFNIHESLKDFHKIVQDVHNDEDIQKSKTLMKLSNFALDKNAKLMGHIFRLMLRAKSNEDKVIELSQSDLDALGSHLVSPKELYLQISNQLMNEEIND